MTSIKCKSGEKTRYHPGNSDAQNQRESTRYEHYQSTAKALYNSQVQVIEQEDCSSLQSVPDSYSTASFSQGKQGIVSKVPSSKGSQSPLTSHEDNLSFALPERLATENSTFESCDDFESRQCSAVDLQKI